MPDSVDNNLAARARAGDRQAYAALVKDHYRRVFLTCLGVLGRASEAEDVTQEVFLKAATRLRQIKDPALFAAWICRIARHESINLLRRNRRMKVKTDRLAESSDGREATHGIEIERAVEDLPRDLREPLVMVYFEGLEVREVARRLGRSQSRIYQRLRIAHERLRGLLVQQGDVS